MLPYNTQQTIFYTMLVIFDVSWLVINASLYFFYRNTETIQKRNPLLIALIAVGFLLFYHGVLFSWYVTSSVTYPWSETILVHILIGSGGALFLISYTLMGLSLAVNLILAKVKMELSETPIEPDYKPPIDKWQLILIRIFKNLQYDPFYRNNKKSSGSKLTVQVSELEKSQTETKSNDQAPSWLLELNPNLSNRVILLQTAMALTIISIVIVVSIIIWYPQSKSQLSSSGGKIFLSTVAYIVLLLLINMLIALRGHKDSLGIKLELVCFICSFIPTSTLFLIVEFSTDQSVRKFQEDVGSITFLVIQGIGTFASTNAFWLFYSIWETRRKANLLSNDEKAKKISQKTGIDDLIDIILNDQTFNQLKSNLQQDLCPENGMFIEHLFQGYARFKRQLVFNNCEPIDVAKAMPRYAEKSTVFRNKSRKDCISETSEFDYMNRLYKLYIKANSPNELNIPSKLREHIKQNLEAPNNIELNLHLFDGVKDEVFKMIYMNNYPRFKRSQMRKSAVKSHICL